MRWIDEIYEAFVELNGVARYDDLFEYIQRTTSRDLPKSWHKIIRDRVRSFSSDSNAFRGVDLFQNLGASIWGIREFEIDKEMVIDREKCTSKSVVDTILGKNNGRSFAKKNVAGGVLDFHLLSNGPRPVAPFSHAVETDGWVILTGQMPTDPDAPDAPLPEGIEAQTARVMDNFEIILKGIGLDLTHVLQCRAYLTEFERDYAAFNDTYQTYFPQDRRPARTTIGVTALAVGALVEIDCIAKRPA